MIILDTNVLSELMRSAPSEHVHRWLSNTSDDALLTTVITVSEIEYGIARLPDGKRRSELADRFASLLGPEFGLTPLPLDEPAARLAGLYRHQRVSLGLNAQLADMFIAGIAAHFGAVVATRNVGDFSNLGIEIINPWAS